MPSAPTGPVPVPKPRQALRHPMQMSPPSILRSWRRGALGEGSNVGYYTGDPGYYRAGDPGIFDVFKSVAKVVGGAVLGTFAGGPVGGIIGAVKGPASAI